MLVITINSALKNDIPYILQQYNKDYDDCLYFSDKLNTKIVINNNLHNKRYLVADNKFVEYSDTQPKDWEIYFGFVKTAFYVEEIPDSFTLNKIGNPTKIHNDWNI